MHSYSQRFAAKLPGVDLTTNYVNGVKIRNHAPCVSDYLFLQTLTIDSSTSTIIIIDSSLGP